MSSLTITINDQKVAVPAEFTILEAAKKLDISIPSLCYLNGFDRFTSCMICVVYEINSKKLLPSCSAVVSEGMRIETDNEKVKEARKAALDFLLSEHVGDCEAPCQRACPAHMNIPQMIRQIENNLWDQAIATVRADIALPAVLGRICSAPCEKGCNRKFHDNPVSVCLLKRFVADVDLARATPYRPAVKAGSGKKIAIIGTGPTGLSAAYYLLQQGHTCHLYDQNSQPGGMLRYGVPDDQLPKSVLDAEIEQVSALGAKFHLEKTLGEDFGLAELRSQYDSIVLGLGKVPPNLFDGSGIDLTPRGLAINRETFETSVPGVFAGGNAVTESRMAIRSLAHGKGIAYSISHFLNHGAGAGIPNRFNSLMGKLRNGEKDEFLKEAQNFDRISPEKGLKGGFVAAEAQNESRRCFGCDCRKLESCQLRGYSEQYQANQQRYKLGGERRFEKILQHELVIYEPGKCIKCGLCVQVTKKSGEQLGLTFVNRGFEVRVDTPLNETIANGIKKAASACVEACPTAALAFRIRQHQKMD